MISFTVITPTLLRPSLMTCNSSVASQSHPKVQHIVMIDGPTQAWTSSMNSNREVHSTGAQHHDFGNFARNKAWELAKGDYICYLDDDNFMTDRDSLARVAAALEMANRPAVGFFPILRFGERFFPPIPTVVGTVDTANMVIKREIGKWPTGGGYEADGNLAEYLFRTYLCSYFPDVAPIITVPEARRGK